MLVETRLMNKQEVSVVSSLDVAETFGKDHSKVLRDIRELGCSEEFRLSNFGQSNYMNEQNHKQPMYYMTRDGFTLLVMGYSGEKAMRFKEAYIKQFNQMERLLRDKLEERSKGIAVRQALTKAIQQSNENERMHGHAYSTYTNMIYKILFGMNAKGLREKFGISNKEDLRDHFSIEEIKQIEIFERFVSSLVDFGYGYDEIKGLTEKQPIKLITQ